LCRWHNFILQKVAQFTPLKWLSSVRQGGSTISDTVAQLGRYLHFRRLRHAQVQQHSYNRVNCYFEDGLTEELMSLEQESPLDLLVQKETEEELYLGVQALDPRTRRRLILHFISGLTQQQIADNEGVNRSNVARSISLGVRQLRKIISGNF
jgi:RNA polymerase sigma factor (sigma-70 family)